MNSAGRLQSLFHSSLIVYSCCASLGSQGGCALELQVLKSFCNEQKCWKRVYPMENHSLENHDTLVVFTVSSNTVLELIKCSVDWWFITDPMLTFYPTVIFFCCLFGGGWEEM